MIALTKHYSLPHFLFAIVAVVFVFLLGFANEVFAAAPAPTTPTTPTNDTTPTWTWNVYTDAGGSQLKDYTVGWCAKDTFPQTGADSCASNTASVSLPGGGATTVSFTHSTALAEGKWYFRVKATDNATNESAWSENGSVEVDLVCVPPASGDWEITRNCVLTDRKHTIKGNVIVQSAGILDMRGSTNIEFDNSATRYVYVYPGGQIFQAGTAGFNK